MPVPGIFLVKQADAKLLVLDGQQRLRTLQSFYKDLLIGHEFILENVQLRLVGKSYATLDSEDRRRLDDSIIHATIVRQDEPGDDQGSIYLVFEGLNTGGTSLKPQEIRVALYRGGLVNMLRELNEHESWRSLYLRFEVEEFEGSGIDFSILCAALLARKISAPNEGFFKSIYGEK